jgi:hypothetical protein
VGDDVGWSAGGGLGSSGTFVSTTTTVTPVEVDTPSGPVTVVVSDEVMEVVLLEVVEGAAVVDPPELGVVDFVVGPVDEGLVVREVVGAVVVGDAVGAVVVRDVEVEPVLRLLVVVVFDCRFTNSTRRVASAARSWWMTSRARRSPGNTPCLNLGPL